MKKPKSSEFLIELFLLLFIAIAVQTVYATIIRPKAEAIRTADLALMQKDPNYVPELKPWVIVKDPEQETCFIFAIWAIATMALKSVGVARSRKLLGDDLLHLPDGMKILPEDTREYARQIEALPDGVRTQLLPRALMTALHRFGATRDIQDVSVAARNICEVERDRLDSELGMVRFVAWAIPAIGFIGTVRGIGQSLQQAHKAVEGDVSGVVAGLGVSFNATLVALSLSILVMLVLHSIQLRQERLGLDVEEYVDSHVVQNLQVR
jgi:biopolymer transport protein ExbB/TolQ